LSQNAGAAYVYVREPARVSGVGTVLQAPHWFSTENMKLIGPDSGASDRFATSVDIDRDMIFIGAPGNDGFALDAGAAYFFKAGFSAVSFAQVPINFIVFRKHDN